MFDDGVIYQLVLVFLKFWVHTMSTFWGFHTFILAFRVFGRRAVFWRKGDAQKRSQGALLLSNCLH